MDNKEWENKLKGSWNMQQVFVRSKWDRIVLYERLHYPGFTEINHEKTKAG